ncbi:hypothetical protein CPC08DRAFT_819830 [Agrocybe pediades]|nr:hypothetical protein CPC08DRAFT_819830 [Agrocybe pediades]
MSYTWNIPNKESELKKYSTTKKNPRVLEEDRYPAMDTQRRLKDRIPHTNSCSTILLTGRLASEIDASTRELINVRHQLEKLRGCWTIMRRSLTAFLGKDAVRQGSHTKQGVLTSPSVLGKRRLSDETDAEATRPRFKRRRSSRHILPERREALSHLTYTLRESFPDFQSDSSFTPSQSSACDSDVDIDRYPTSLLSPITDYAAPCRKAKLTNQRMPQCSPRPNGSPRFRMNNRRIDFNPETRKYEVIRDPDLVDADARLEDLLDNPIESVFRTIARTLATTYEFVVLEDYFEVPITPENNIIRDGDPDYPSYLRNQPIQEFNEMPEGFTVPVDADGNVDLTLLYRQYN